MSVEQNNEITIPELTTPPQSIYIGNGVLAEIAFQVKEISYAAEGNLQTEKKEYLDALEYWRAYAIDFAPATVSEVKSKSANGIYANTCFYFENNSFRVMLDTERESYDVNVQQAWIEKTDRWASWEVDAKYQDYQIKKEIFLSALSESLAEQEAELAK